MNPTINIELQNLAHVAKKALIYLKSRSNKKLKELVGGIK